MIRDDQNTKGNGRALHARKGGLGDPCFLHHMKLVLGVGVHSRPGVLAKHLFETEIRNIKDQYFLRLFDQFLIDMNSDSLRLRVRGNINKLLY